MKKFTIVLMLVMAFSLTAAADEIPPGIRYIKAPDELNMKVQKKLEQVFSQTPVKLDDLFGPRIVCGPIPWNQFKGQEPFRNLKIAKVDFVLGGQQSLEGAFFQTGDQISAFCRAMEKYLGPGPFKIRKPNADELKIYWAMIPYDITEPIFVADNKDHKLLTHFTDDTKTLIWIGDLQGMRLGR